MGSIGTLFDAIKKFYAWPFHQYKFNYDSFTCDSFYGPCKPDRDWFLTVMTGALVLFVTVFVSALLLLIGWSIHRQYTWLRDRQRCQHCSDWTLWESNGEYPRCVSGQACCDDCDWEHQAEAEEKIHCPNSSCHSQVMNKVISDHLIYDRCERCGTIVLGAGELDVLEMRAYDRGYSDGRTTGTATGAAIGIAIS